MFFVAAPDGLCYYFHEPGRVGRCKVADKATTERRVVSAPTATGRMGTGEVLSVEAGPDEAVEWLWTHDREGSRVTGYRVVARPAEQPLS